mmetsp:Transcript_22003/g.62519  ORF Transcript_22003/g.62519 Transcript_22003/m.62519 type:complete len:384 (-) Transcript_22003:681-1832(-)
MARPLRRQRAIHRLGVCVPLRDQACAEGIRHVPAVLHVDPLDLVRRVHAVRNGGLGRDLDRQHCHLEDGQVRHLHEVQPSVRGADAGERDLLVHRCRGAPVGLRLLRARHHQPCRRPGLPLRPGPHRCGGGVLDRHVHDADTSGHRGPRQVHPLVGALVQFHVLGGRRLVRHAPPHGERAVVQGRHCELPLRKQLDPHIGRPVLPLRLRLDHGARERLRAIPRVLRGHQLVLHEEGRRAEDRGAAEPRGLRGPGRRPAPRGEHLPRRGDHPLGAPHPRLQLGRGRGRAQRGGRLLRAGRERLRGGLREQALRVRRQDLQRHHGQAEVLLHPRLLRHEPGAPDGVAVLRGLRIPVLEERLQRRHHPLPALPAGVPKGVPAHQQV